VLFCAFSRCAFSSSLEVYSFTILRCRIDIPLFDGYKLSTDEHGKPYLVGHTDFHFNISHAGRYVVCAFSDAPVGIDIEVIASADMKIAERFFAGREKMYIFEQTSEFAQREAFYRVWTMKEAYIKREGRGLGIPLPSFDVFDDMNVYFSEIYSNSEVICHCCTDRMENQTSFHSGSTM
jgi:phosphopantetheine--protein transferase-like protein